jgi:hypothetical protein
MAGRIYTVTMAPIAVTAQQDLFEINVATTKCTEFLELHLSQSTEVGDAQEEGLAITVKTGSTTSGTGGTAVTAIPTHLGDAAFAGTCEINNTTKAVSGTIVTHFMYNWNVRVPLDVIYTPETTKMIAPSGRLTVELGTTPADSITMGGYAVIRELG